MRCVACGAGLTISHQRQLASSRSDVAFDGQLELQAITETRSSILSNDAHLTAATTLHYTTLHCSSDNWRHDPTQRAVLSFPNCIRF